MLWKKMAVDPLKLGKTACRLHPVSLCCSVWLWRTISHLVPRLPGYFLCSILAINHLLGTVRNGGIVKKMAVNLLESRKDCTSINTPCVSTLCQHVIVPNYRTLEPFQRSHGNIFQKWDEAHVSVSVCVYTSWVQFKMVSMHTEKPKWAPPHLSEFRIPPMLPLKWFHHQQWAEHYKGLPPTHRQSRNEF